MFVFIMLALCGLIDPAAAAPKSKAPVADPPAPTLGASDAYGVSAAEPEAKEVKDLSASYKDAMKTVAQYKKAKKRGELGDIVRLADAVQTFGSIMLERSEVRADYEVAAKLLLEADPGLASRTIVGLWKSANGRGEFEPMVVQIHDVLVSDLGKIGIEIAKRPSDLSPKSMSDCSARIDKIAAVAQVADDLKRLDELRGWRLLGADYAMICMGRGGDLEAAYNSYAAYTETVNAKKAARLAAEDALNHVKIAAPVAQASTGRMAGGAPIATTWQAEYVGRAMTWFMKAGESEASIRARIQPLAAEAEEAEQYRVAHEIYTRLGDDANRLRMELLLGNE